MGETSGRLDRRDRSYRVAMKVRAFAACCLALAVAGCRTRASHSIDKQPAPARSASLAGARVAGQPPAADDGQWVMPAKDYASTRYSALGQITAANVGQAEAGVDLLDRQRARARGGAARGGQHDVRRHAVPEHPLRARSHQARRRR